VIDLRSDTVTRPSKGMRRAMYEAELGDDVYGEDPAVNALERRVAALCGKEAGLFAASGTQANLLALLSHCQRGHEYIAGCTAHTYLYEGGGAAVLGGIQPCPIAFNERGELPLAEVEAAIKPDDSHFAITRLVCLENTTDGKVLGLDYLRQYDDMTARHGLGRHLDGARLFNAAVALGVDASEITGHFDTVSVCLSKGLGAPVGSVLAGDADTIARARRWRKMVGGGMRQAGVIAAAGLYALDNNVKRLQEDHARAARLADSLKALPGFRLDHEPQTNMLFLHGNMALEPLTRHLADAGITINAHRWVLHLDVSDEDVATITDACRRFADQQAGDSPEAGSPTG
jgi:threonine aldolase